MIDATGGVYFTDPSFSLDGKSNQGVHGVFYIAADGKLSASSTTSSARTASSCRPTEDAVPDPVLRACWSTRSLRDGGASGPGGGSSTARSSSLRAKREGEATAGRRSRGNVYIAAATGVQVSDPQGKLLGTIKVPKAPPTVNSADPI